MNGTDYYKNISQLQQEEELMQAIRKENTQIEEQEEQNQ